MRSFLFQQKYRPVWLLKYETLCIILEWSTSIFRFKILLQNWNNRKMGFIYYTSVFVKVERSKDIIYTHEHKLELV